ncbi:MAG: PepSY-like domain-containing protein [Salibacteraceae bacterium]|nr:PepSY-like domain-containing protein [Salibacteraceae bacterium]
MKNKALNSSLVLIILALSACGQTEVNHQIKAKAEKHLIQNFKAATNINWDQEGDEIEAEFEEAGINYSVKYSAQGEWLETEKELNADALPAEIIAAINAKFANAEIEDAEWVETAKESFYELNVEADHSDYEVKLTPNGNIISSTIEEDEED